MKSPQDNPHRKLLKVGMARKLRRDMTESELKLWADLRGKRFGGLRFRRQQPIGPYVADFYCAAARLIIEVDGGHHTAARNVANDAARTEWLEANGFRVLRITNFNTARERNIALDAIWHAVHPHTHPDQPAGSDSCLYPLGGQVSSRTNR